MILNELKAYPLRYKFVIILFVIDLFAWLLAGFSMYYIKYSREAMDIICLFSLIIAGTGMISSKNVKLASGYLFACLVIILIPVVMYGDIPFVAVVSKLCFAVAFITLRLEIKNAIFKIFLKLFTIIVSLGIIEYVLLFFNINFTWAEVERMSPYQLLNQGIFILIPSYSIEAYARFMSLCEEPGDLGNICFFLLATINYKEYKKTYLILLFAGLISFSLGFYVLITLWILINSRKIGFSQIIVGIFAITFLLTYFSGFVEETIVERVAGRSIAEIDNRTNYEVSKKLVEISHDERIYIGMGNRNFYDWQEKIDGTSAGAKNFLFQYGVLGLSLLIVSFTTIVIKIRGYNKETLLILIFFWIAFYKSSLWNSPPILVALLGCMPMIEAQLNKRKKIKVIHIPQYENSIS